MRATLSRLVLTLIALSAALSLVACNRSSERELRVAVNPWPGYEALFLAEHLGLYKKVDLKVRLIEFQSLGDARRAFERGQVDVFASTVVELLASRANSRRRAQAIYAIDFSDGADILLGRPGIERLADLKGKRVAVEPASVDIVVLHHALQSVGLSLRDVTVVPLSQQELLSAYRRGEIDAAESYPPVVFDLMKHGARKLFDSSQIPGVILDVLIADADVVNARKDHLVRLVQAFAQAQALVMAGDNEIRAIMAKRESISIHEFNEAYLAMKIISPSDQRNLFVQNGAFHNVLTSSMEALKATGQVRKEINLSDTYTLEIAREVTSND